MIMIHQERKYFYAFLCCHFLAFCLQARHDTLYTCRPGEEIQLEVDTSFAGYRWLPADGLSNPTIPTPIASPRVTTTYIVESIGSAGQNLITNGDFSQGNEGFTSGYVYSPGANPTQGVYGIFPNANDLSPDFFSHCRDHTTGQGNLMAVDGSPQANVEVWCQRVAVEPNTTYGFSTWVTSIYPPNPARLQFSINGVPLAQPFEAGIDVCEWRQFYATWSSEENTEAEICIVNQNTNPQGNDFALDDFSFFQLAEVVYDTFTVVVENIVPTQIDTSVCAGAFVEFNGEVIPADTSVQFRFTSVHGCDSLVRLNVGVLDTIYEYILVDTLCPGETIDFFGHTIVRDTVICETFPISTSCDSTYCLTAVFLTETALEAETVEPSCAGAQDGRIAITPRAGLPPYSYRWSTGATSPTIEPISRGTYTLSVTDSKGCTAEREVTLEEPPPLAAEVTARSKLCNGEVNGVLDFAADGGTPPYTYSIDGGLIFQSQPIRQNLTPGTYDILVRDANGCLAEQTVVIPAPMGIELIAPEDARLPLGDAIQVNIQSSTDEILTYQWTPDTGVSCPTCPTTIIQPLGNTVYTISAADPDGCRWQTDWSVAVYKEPDVYIPNAFSPNGDGRNDLFALYNGRSVRRVLRLQVFDRWGTLLFQSGDCLSGEALCQWDGRTRERPAGEGVYLYLATIEYIDGTTEFFSGDLLLTR